MHRARKEFLYTLVAVIALWASGATANANIIVESRNTPLTVRHNQSSFTYTLADETGGNSSSLLLVGRTSQDATTATSHCTIDTGDGAVSADLFLTESTGSESVAWWVFDLGDATAGNITINNSNANRETYTIFQLSGAILTDAVTSSSSGVSGTPQTSMTGTTAGSFLGTLMIHSGNSGSLDAMIGPSDENGRGQFQDAWYYSYAENIAGGDFDTGFDLSGGVNAAVVGIALAPIPEPATISLLAIGGLGVLTRRRLSSRRDRT